MDVVCVLWDSFKMLKAVILHAFSVPLVSTNCTMVVHSVPVANPAVSQTPLVPHVVCLVDLAALRPIARLVSRVLTIRLRIL